MNELVTDKVSLVVQVCFLFANSEACIVSQVSDK